MKQSIEWHKGCLKNQQIFLLEEKINLKEQFNKVNNIRKDVLNYENQITKAEEKGMDSFDRERFLKPKK